MTPLVQSTHFGIKSLLNFAHVGSVFDKLSEF